jgi:hypothetical protein
MPLTGQVYTPAYAAPAVKSQMLSEHQNRRMAREQWDWQKRLYGEQQAAGRASQGAMSRLVNQYNQAYGQARTANERRYQQLLGIADQTTGQRAADIRSDYASRESDIMQNLARLGMANTTVAPTMALGVEREQQSALNRLADQMQGTKLGIIERRTDRYPDANVLTSLASMMGQGGGGASAANALSRMRLS